MITKIIYKYKFPHFEGPNSLRNDTFLDFSFTERRKSLFPFSDLRGGGVYDLLFDQGSFISFSKFWNIGAFELKVCFLGCVP